jgi:Spy/CpxP family protein refolding chaperone
MFIKRIYFWSLLFLCFVFGAVSGTVYETMANKETKRSRRVRTTDMVKQIDMTQSQRAQLNKVLESSRKRMIELNRSIRPELSKIRQETQGQIREMLTTDQRAKFDQLIAEQDQARRLRSQQAKTKTKQSK